MSCWLSVGPMPSVSSPATGTPVVLDASAVLALLFEEPGAEVVRAQAERAASRVSNDVVSAARARAGGAHRSRFHGDPG